MKTLAELIRDGNVYAAETIVGKVWKPLGKVAVEYKSKSIRDIRLVGDSVCINQGFNGEVISWEPSSLPVFEVYESELLY